LSVYCAEKNQRATHIARYSRFLTIIILVFVSTLTVEKAYNKATKDIEIKHKTIIERSLQARDGVREYLPDATPEIYYEQVNSLRLDRVEKLFSGNLIPIKSEYTFYGEQITVTIDNHQPQSIIMNQFYFPTWRGVNLGNNQELLLSRSKDGFLEFALDKGAYKLRFEHEYATSEIFGFFISVTMIVLTTFGLLRDRKCEQRSLKK
jgi:hypothetical protein